MSRVRVVALGRLAAGDDGVGTAVLADLRRRGASGDLELLDLADAAHLVTILLESGRVVLVDAVVGTPPGRVIEPTPEELAVTPHPVALHGFGAGAAIALACALSSSALELQIVGVTIAPPVRPAIGLSPEVAASVPIAADRVLAVIGARRTLA